MGRSRVPLSHNKIATDSLSCKSDDPQNDVSKGPNSSEIKRWMGGEGKVLLGLAFEMRGIEKKKTNDCLRRSHQACTEQIISCREVKSADARRARGRMGPR
jgi:hypothetical protein